MWSSAFHINPHGIANLYINVLNLYVAETGRTCSLSNKDSRYIHMN